ncbi:sensor histidine kinase [Nocardioides sp. SR21]|uniref:sensor histidine kinase n=1 Tax=Nocardioides sp. SR21 TaxID=2919501 RepID=UPI001FAB0DDE|nr:sensor histidine kinase [Nocardioides sp. SR21]
MRNRIVPVATAAGGLLCVALALVVAVDLAVRDEYRPEVDQLLRGVTAGIAYGGLGGFLAARRPQLSIGWVMLLIGFSNAFSSATAVLADRTLTDDTAVTDWAFWLSTWSWAPGYVLVPTVLLLLLPNGRPYGRFGRALVAVAAAGTALVTLAWAVTPYDQQDYALPERYAHLTNPVGIDGAGVLLPVSLAAVLVGMAAGLVTLALRLRTSRGHEREQVYWVLAGASLTVLLLVGGFVFADASDAIIALAMLPLPLAITWSSVRRRLWDLDQVVNKFLVVAVVGGLGAIVGAVLPVPAGLAAAVAAVVVLPVVGPVQQAVNRFLYRDATEPTAAVHRLGDQVGAATSPREALTRVLEVVATTLAAEGVEARLTDGTVVAYGTTVGEQVTIPLVHHQVTVGGLVIAVPPGGLGARGEALLGDLARHAAVVAHAIALQDAVQLSREQVVVAREEERRRIRNDLHDDLGPRLAATALQLENAVDMVVDDPGRAVQVLERATGYLRDGVADVRRIVDDLRPAALDDLGLEQAVREQATRLGLHGLAVTVTTDGDLAGLSAAAEVAAYRICSEAMTNVARHADARQLRVRLARVPEGVTIEVADDGSGLPDDLVPGVGLGSMHQRAAELGGTCVVQGGPGTGTAVTATIPVEAR